MSRRSGSIGRAYFDELYAGDPDPWRFASSEYEREKYAASLSALPAASYDNALEVGCSIGIFTKLLATKCHRLLSLDVAEAALAQARLNCQASHVIFQNRCVPKDWPLGKFDLIVFSEVLYYLDEQELSLLAGQVRQSLLPGGTTLLVHYLGETDYPLSGDSAADLFIAQTNLHVLYQRRTEAYRIDVLTG
jgi:SAM-dependent methyltransferase